MSCSAYTLTKHAAERALERGISSDELERMKHSEVFKNEAIDPVDCKVITVFKPEWAPPRVPCKHNGEAMTCPKDVSFTIYRST